MKNFLWVDLEMTGLDEKIHHVLEVAAVVTDEKLKVLDQMHRIVHQPEDILALMDEWCVRTHGESGLTAAVRTGTPLEKVEDELLALIDKHFKPDERIVLSGNSVGNDRRFIDAYMIRVAKRLHYRLLDVSSFKEVFRERYGIRFEKKNAHRAIDDVFESIRELETYLQYVKIPPQA